MLHCISSCVSIVENRNFRPCIHLCGSRDSLLVGAPDSWSKSFEFESGRSGRRIFFSRVNLVCWLVFGVYSTPVLLQWHVKDHGHSAESAGGRLHLTTHTSWTQWSQSGLTMPLSRHSVGTYLEKSSYATYNEGTLRHSRLSSLSRCGLILAERVELECLN